MGNRRQFDLVVIGDDLSGLAAAACAARRGAACAVISTGHEPTEQASVASIPNFVWRRLDLHETGLTPEPVSACVSLFNDAEAITTFADDHDTIEALDKTAPADSALWSDFRSEMRRKQKSKRPTGEQIVASPERLHQTAPLDGMLTDSMAGLLDDYFTSDHLKTHLASVAGLTFGIGGEEPGSGFALASASDWSAWRVKNDDTLVETLNRVCEKLSVEKIAYPIRRIERHDNRNYNIDFDLGDGLRARAVMASSLRIATAMGLRTEDDPSPLAAPESAEALISVKLSETSSPPVELKDGLNAIYYIAETEDEIRAARDAVLEGRTPENPPLMFELGDKEIIARTPYCPRLLASEDGPREWTGQDRQILGKQVLQRLGKYLNGALETVQRTDVKVFGAAELDPEHPLNENMPTIHAPAPEVNEIAAAARLAMRLVRGG